MNESNNITINSEEIMSSVSILDELLNLFESSLLTSISADFSNLQELDLLTEGLAALKKQIESLCTSIKNLMTKITVHAEEFAQLESELTSFAQSYGSTYSAGSSGYSGSSSDISAIAVQEVNNGTSVTTNGTSINNENVLESINKIDSETQIKLIDFLNTNKGSDTSIEQLLFDSSKSGMLLALLKKFYGDSSENLETIVSDTSSSIQKSLLDKLYSNDSEKVTFSNSSILSAKQFFIQIAKENNVTVSELILDEKNKKIIIDAVAKVYDGNGIGSYNISDDEITTIRNAVDNVAKNKNVTAEDVIKDSKYTSILIGI